ncbi:MAG: hypothetical protein ACR2G6_10070 [Gemmatimonadaceae bacterium]
MLRSGRFANWVTEKDSADFDKQNGNHGPDTAFLEPENIANCTDTTPNGHIRVEVASEKRAKKLKKGEIGQHGAVLARITNLTSCKTKGFVLESKQVLYWIAVPNAQHAMGMTFDFVEKRRRVSSHVAHECSGNKHPQRDTSHAYMIAGLEGADVCDYKKTQDKKDLAPITSHNSRPWVTCQGGCCVALR